MSDYDNFLAFEALDAAAAAAEDDATRCGVVDWDAEKSAVTIAYGDGRVDLDVAEVPGLAAHLYVMTLAWIDLQSNATDDEKRELFQAVGDLIHTKRIEAVEKAHAE